MEKKITRATVKAFIKKNRENLYIRQDSRLDGMIDGIEMLNGGFEKAERDDRKYHELNTLRVKNLWLAGNSRDYFRFYADGKFTGIEYTNCCASGVLAIKGEN
jgi:hypothetical protein